MLCCRVFQTDDRGLSELCQTGMCLVLLMNTRLVNSSEYAESHITLMNAVETSRWQDLCYWFRAVYSDM